MTENRIGRIKFVSVYSVVSSIVFTDHWIAANDHDFSDRAVGSCKSTGRGTVVYRDRLAAWEELMQLSDSICKVVRIAGYHRTVAIEVERSLPAARTVEGETLIRRSVAFLNQMQGRQCETGTLPASSEVIESIFGRGKRLEGQQSRSGFTTQLLSMAACVVKPTKQFIIDALKTCRTKHIDQWREEYLGRSLQSRRRRDLGPVQRTETCGAPTGRNPKD